MIMMLLLSYFLGFVSCLMFLYTVGVSRRRGHASKTTTGPNSKAFAHENVIPILSKREG